MYTEWFKLKKLPFRLRPDPDFLFLGGGHAHAYAALRAAAGESHGLVTLVGETGLGKTTLLHALAQEHRGSIAVGRLQQPGLTPQELQASLAEQFHLNTQEAGSELGTRLARFIAEESGQGRQVLVLVDEAHRCPANTLRELMLLAALKPAPVVVLAGESELLAALSGLEGQGVPRQTVAALELQRLEPEQIAKYLNFRLQVAGRVKEDTFDPESMAEILRYTGGTPQLINMLADSAMALAETRSSPRVGPGEIRDAVHQLKWVEFGARTNGSSPASPSPAAAPAASRAIVMEIEVQQSGRYVDRYVLKPGRVVVGRSPQAEISLDSQFVSREHCQVMVNGDQCFVEDLGSTNGLLVNGRRRRIHRMVPGDRVVVGDHTLIYHETPATVW